MLEEVKGTRIFRIYTKDLMGKKVKEGGRRRKKEKKGGKKEEKVFR